MRISTPLMGLIVALTISGCAAPGPDIEKDRALILVVDGLRPDYVTEEMMPRLNELAERGVRGLAHHSVYPTVTRINGPSIFTGHYPSGHGLMGNTVYMPEVNASRTLSIADRNDVLEIDRVTGGALLTAPSMGELLEQQGMTLFAVSSGSTGSATLINHTGAGAGLVHHEFTVPEELGTLVSDNLGPFTPPPADGHWVGLVARAVDALLRIGIDEADADVLAGWLTEPDHSAHAEGIGAPATKEVLLGVDAEIGRLLDGLEERGVLSQTNIIVVSDHGFSTRTGEVSLTQLLVDAGLKESAQSLDVVVAGDAIHVEEGGDEMVATIVELLQDTDWVGPVFTRSPEAQSELGGYPGTVSFSLVGWDHDRSADILMSPDWTDAENEFGFRGEVLSPGTAGHGSASPWDIRATFVAVGPGIKSFVASPVPTGNVDILPTVFELMGVPIPGGLDGRVLSEVLESGPFPGEVELETSVVETSTEVRGTRYELTIHQSRGGTSTYFDGFDVARVPGG